MADSLIVTPGQIVAPPDWDALAQQHGGIKSSVMIPPTDSRVQALIQANPDLAATFQQHPIYRYYMADNSYVEAYDQENGQDVQVVDYQPSQKFKQQQTTEQRQAAANQAPASGKPFIDDGPEAGASGRRWGYSPQTGLYDRDLGPSPTAQQQPKPTTGRKSEPVKDHPGIYEVTTTDATTNETETHYENASGQTVDLPAAPTAGGTIVERPDGAYIIKPDGTATKVQGVPPPDAPKGTLKDTPDGTFLISADGKTATRVQGLPPPAQAPYVSVHQDPDTKQWWGLTKEGRWEQMQGGPGTNQPKPGAGPPLPQIILGHSQDALRAYQQQLNAEVQAGTMTPAERQNRWNEAVQTATFTYNEASLQQRENETNLNASVNLATNRLSNATSGFNAALSFVSNLNDKLPPGSDLGGKAFAAILGLQLENARRMGAYDNIKPGSQRSVFAEQGPGAAPGPSTPPPAPTTAGQVPPPPAPTVPTTPAQPDAAAAQAEADRQQQAAASGAVPDVAPPPAPAPVPPSPTSNQSATPPVPAAERPDDVLTIVRKDGRGTPVTVSRQLWNSSPDFQANNSVVNAQPNPRPWPGAGAAPQSQIAPQDEEYAVLAQARQNQPPPQPFPTAPPPGPPPDSGGYRNPMLGYPNDVGRPPRGTIVDPEGIDRTNDVLSPPPGVVRGGNPDIPGPDTLYRQPLSVGAPDDSDMPAAVLHAQARISPPWRLSPQRIQQMLAAGVPAETIWGVPRRIA